MALYGLHESIREACISEVIKMSQMVFIDEDELKELQMYKNIAEQYRKTFEKVYPILLPEVNNLILSNPIRNWEYDCYLLEGIAKNILNKRRKKHKLWQK